MKVTMKDIANKLGISIDYNRGACAILFNEVKQR